MRAISTHTDFKRWVGGTATHGSVVSAAILGPVFVFVLMLLIQAVMYYHARSLAVAAGEEALKQAAAQYGTSAAGTAAAYAFIGAANAGAMQAPVVVVNRTPTVATVDVTGTTPALLIFWRPIVHVHLEEPVERITIPGVPA